MALYFGYGRRHSHLNPNYKGAD
jgi:hypothetical protein